MTWREIKDACSHGVLRCEPVFEGGGNVWKDWGTDKISFRSGSMGWVGTEVATEWEN